MARMPGAVWLGEHSPRRLMARYDIVCIHTIVGWAPAHAAHFSVKRDGTILQSRDTRYQSAANLYGNPRVIAIENEDGGDWAAPLTPAQVASNARILAWVHETHGTPLQLCPDSRPGSRGLAYHRQGVSGNFGGYRFPGRVSGGEVWSNAYGKVCPGDNKIAQRPEILSRAKAIVSPAKPAAPSWKWNPDVVSDLAIIQRQFQIAAGYEKGDIKRYHGVAAIQNALNVKASEKLTVDGLCGPATVAAWKRWEIKHPGTGRATTPDMKSLAVLQIAYRFKAPVAVQAPKPEPKPAPTPAPAPAKVTLSVMTWNVENKGDHAADVKELREILAEHKPDVVCLQEAYRLDLSGIPGYREVYHASKGYPSGSENPAQAILVRDGVTVKDKKPLVMRLPWFGPKLGIKHDPRIHRYVDVVKSGRAASVSTWHTPFGKDQIEETRKALVAWLKKAGVRIAVADLNDLARDTAARVGTPAGAKVDGGGLDKVLFKIARLVKSLNLGKRGRSDHPVKIWVFEI